MEVSRTNSARIAPSPFGDVAARTYNGSDTQASRVRASRPSMVALMQASTSTATRLSLGTRPRASTTPALGCSPTPGRSDRDLRSEPGVDVRALVGQRDLSAVRLGEDPRTVSAVLDAAARRRSPATMPGYHAGRAPRNKGQLYPAPPPTVRGDRCRDARGRRRPPWLAAARHNCGALARRPARPRGACARRTRPRSAARSLLVRNGKGGRGREVGMDAWGWEQLRPWLDARVELPVGPLFCVIDGPPRGRPWSSANVRVEFRRLATQAGIRRRFAPHQLRHAPAVELARDGVPVNIIQRQLSHAPAGHSTRPPLRRPNASVTKPRASLPFTPGPRPERARAARAGRARVAAKARDRAFLRPVGYEPWCPRFVLKSPRAM